MDNDASLRLSYFALSTARLGHDNHDDNLLASSKRFYCKALGEMQLAISDPRRRHKEETLLACFALSLYEMFEAQTLALQVSGMPNGWLSHAAGIGRLIEARGPESFTTDKAHPVFLQARILIASRESTARRRSFLSEPKWLTVPFKNHPKSLRHKVIDVMVCLPTILEAYDEVRRSPSLNSERTLRKGKSLLAQCVTLCEQLRSWYAKLCVDADGRTLWHTSPSDDPSYPFPHIFSFENPLVAHTVMLYWTCSLAIQATMRQLERLMNTGITNMADVVTLPENINPGFHAGNIAQSLLYFLHPDMGALGPNLTMFPIGMAFAWFATPARPAFAADWVELDSLGSMVDLMVEGKESRSDTPTQDIVLWFTKLFVDLNSRHMPGATFLSGLMKAVGATQANPVSMIDSV
jgi:Fungal specific transcription factor domain